LTNLNISLDVLKYAHYFMNMYMHQFHSEGGHCFV